MHPTIKLLTYDNSKTATQHYQLHFCMLRKIHSITQPKNKEAEQKQ